MRNPRLDTRQVILFTSLVVPASGTIYSEVVDLVGIEGYLGFYVEVSGSGTISLSYKLGVLPTHLASPSSIYSLLTGHTSSGGPRSDGKTYLFHNPPVCRFFQLLATETGGASSPILTVQMVMG